MIAHIAHWLMSHTWTRASLAWTVRLGASLLLVISLVPVWANEVPERSIENAELSSLSGTRQVKLPHMLEEIDFSPEGSRVVYRSIFTLDDIPANPLGFFVPKMSISGNFYINGQFAGSCLPGRLEEIRCINRPQFFEVSPGLLKSGENTLEFEIYASRHQKNGLATITYGDISDIYDRLYRPKEWLKVDLLIGMTWVSLVFGIVSLSAFFILRKESAYIWFGLACLVHALSIAHLLIGKPIVGIETFMRLGAALRVLSFVTFVMIFLVVIRRYRMWMTVTFMTILILAVVALRFFENFPQNLAIFFAPLLLFSFGLLFQFIRWAFKSNSPLRVMLVWVSLGMVMSAIYDWRTLSGLSHFEQGFIFPYTYSAFLVIFGTTTTRYIARMLKSSIVNLYQAERRNAERMAYAVTKNIPVGTFTLLFGVDHETPKFLFVSDRFLELTGLDRKSLKENIDAMLAIIHVADVESWKSLMARRPSEHQKISKLFRICPSGGDVRWLSTEAVPRQQPDGSTIYEGVLVDKTEEMQAKAEADRVSRAMQLQAIENSKIQERELLIRDMHDGFGSQLAGIRMMAEKGRIPQDKFPQFLMELSADLHLVVDTLGQANTTLSDALADMRYRWDRRFAQIGLKVQWQVALEKLPPMPQRSILHALRLLQEALINAFKHAKARNIWINVQFEANQDVLTMSVRDDGVGMQQPSTGGRGINNMQQRAREIGGKLEFLDHQPGTEVLLTVARVSLLTA